MGGLCVRGRSGKRTHYGCTGNTWIRSRYSGKGCSGGCHTCESCPSGQVGPPGCHTSCVAATPSPTNFPTKFPTNRPTDAPTLNPTTPQHSVLEARVAALEAQLAAFAE